MRVEVDGKRFRLGDRSFFLRGVTYGTFRPRGDAAFFPEREQLKHDLSAMHEAGFTAVRTYTTPPPDLLELAADWDLRVVAGVFWPDWRYLLGSSRRGARRMAADARRSVRAAARELAACEQVMAVAIGNEIPADVVRWMGTSPVAGLLDELADVVREQDDRCLVTYGNYPTAEYLPLQGMDFLTFNVFLERRLDLHRYLTRLHHLAGDRPLVIGELGLDAGVGSAGEQRQADHLDWQLETAIERGAAGTFVFSWTDEWAVGGHDVEGWHFGLTRADRTPRPSLEVARRWNGMAVADLRDDWPSLSVVVCAYNAAATLDECLRHTCALDYPDLEVLVVDDGSTDETAAIARRHPRARLVAIDHAGLSAARNEGLRQASGTIVAYLDSDAYPTPEWPYYLLLGIDGPAVAATGGPNLPPPGDGIGAQVVARSPGGPVHVLVADDRAEHVPGCNMAFRRAALEQLGGFDPVYTAAGDDVDICWKVLDRGWEIGFHPAALVWHHRRAGLGPYLRQQRGYGRAESLVEARHPDRFNAFGTARWRGRIYNALLPTARRPRVYRGPWGAAAYQSVYQGGGHGLDVAHQVGVPIGMPWLLSAPLVLVTPVLGIPGALALVFLGALAIVDAARAVPPRDLRAGRARFRATVALHHLLQPLARRLGRRDGSSVAREGLVGGSLHGPVTTVAGGVLVLPADRPRQEIAAAVVEVARNAGLATSLASEWSACDAHVVGSRLLVADVVTSAHPPGTIQLRVRRRLRLRPLAALLALLAVLTVVPFAGASSGVPMMAAAALVAGAAEQLAIGWWRTGPSLRRAVRSAAAPRTGAPPAGGS